MTESHTKFSDKIYYYQSANNDAKSIKENFVIRIDEFQRIINSLANKKGNDPLQHELILGRRGSGKSTLLKRIEIEITENEQLNNNFIAINFAEEQSSIYRLFDLWNIVIEELNDRFNDNLVAKNYKDFNDDVEYTMHLFDLIRESLKKKKKRLVLLLDNFDRVVESFQDDGNLLRQLLINYNDVQIIGGSTRMNEHFWKYDQPFYEFFRRHHLEALSSNEMIKLILHWSETLEYPKLKDFAKHNIGKIESIRILTDGLPRTLQFFIEILLDNSELYGYDYLKKIMDKVTPIYQERLTMLTPQLRKIVAEMAFLWEACSTKQLVEKCQMKSGLISANLKTLINKGLIDKIETGKKNHLYRISERFFNMWFIVTQGNPTQKRKAKWLSIFLEHWYGKNEFKNLVTEHIKNLQSGNISHNKLLLLSKGISQAKYITTSQRDEIINLSEGFQNKIGNSVIPLPRKYQEISEEILNLVEKKAYGKAIALANEIENEEDGIKFKLLSDLYSNQKYYNKAEGYYLKAIEKEDSQELNNLSILYDNQKNYKKTEECNLKAIEKEDNNALNNLDCLREDQAEYKKVEKHYFEAMENEDDNALFNLVLLHYQKYDEKNALKSIKEYIQKSNTKENVVLQLEIIIEIANGIFDTVEKRIEIILQDFGTENLEFMLLELLVHKQSQLVSKLFNHPKFGEELKERYLVFYYVTLTLIDHKNIELLSTPPEIQEVLNAVLEDIKKEQKAFGYL